MTQSRVHQALIVGVVATCMAGLAYAADQGSGADGQQSSASAGKPYTVKNCNEDGKNCETNKKAFLGWRTYEGFCFRCHGGGAAGSSLAPSLMKRLEGIDFGRFGQVVINGYKGRVGVMPAWGNNPNVNDKLGNLWAWLNAVKDGKLPPGRPERFDIEEKEKAHSNWD